MTIRCCSEKEYSYDIADEPIIYFKYGNSTVISTGKKANDSNKRHIQDGYVIKITSFCDVEEYYDLSEINRYVRSEILSIQSIISFFTGMPFVVYC